MTTIGIPYAQVILLHGREYRRCPTCDKLILCVTRKDVESTSGIEYAKHYAREHEP